MSAPSRQRPARSRFACSEGCGYQGELTDVVYRCRSCGSLLQVEQDVGELRKTSAADWKALFARRQAEVRLPYRSGVWAKKEWVYPDLSAEQIVSLGEGHTPLLPLPMMARELSLESVDLKQCGISPTASFKDLGMTVLVSAVNRMRALGREIRAVVCASTGDTSAALSAYCAAAGIPSVVILPKELISLSQLQQPVANGAIVVSLDTDFDGCMRVVQDVASDPSFYLANSLNPLRIEGQKIAAVELCQQLEWSCPEWIVVPGGNLGNASALGQGLDLMLKLGVIDRRPRIAVAQASAANPLYRAYRTGFAETAPIAAAPTQASAIRIGNPVSMRRAIQVLRDFDGVVEEATESELANAAARADREGAFACPQTGVAVAALIKLAAAGTIGRGSRVVVISTAHGLKFPDFKVGYHRRELVGVDSRFANAPLELPANASAVLDALQRRLDPWARLR